MSMLMALGMTGNGGSAGIAGADSLAVLFFVSGFFSLCAAAYLVGKGQRSAGSRA